MFEKFQLLAHLGALRKFLLLGQGDIMRLTLYHIRGAISGVSGVPYQGCLFSIQI